MDGIVLATVAAGFGGAALGAFSSHALAHRLELRRMRAAAYAEFIGLAMELERRAIMYVAYTAERLIRQPDDEAHVPTENIEAMREPFGSFIDARNRVMVGIATIRLLGPQEVYDAAQGVVEAYDPIEAPVEWLFQRPRPAARHTMRTWLHNEPTRREDRQAFVAEAQKRVLPRWEPAPIADARPNRDWFELLPDL